MRDLGPAAQRFRCVPAPAARPLPRRRQAAARAALGGAINPSVSFASARTGPFWANIWTVTTPWEAGNNLPALIVQPDSVPLGVQVVANLISVASIPAAGSVRLAMGAWCDE